MCLTIVLSLAACPRAHASAWNPDPWGGEIISGYVYSTADRAINDFGDTVSLDIFNKEIVQTYGNLGITPRIAVIGTFDWQSTQISGPGLDTAFSKPSSISAGLQYQLRRRVGHAIAFSMSYIDGIDLPNALLTLESRNSSVEIRGLWGESRTLYKHNVFAEAQLAARMNLAGEYASTHLQLTLGGNVFSRLQLITKGRYSNIEPGQFERLDVSRQTRWEAEASAVYRIHKKNYIELGYSGVMAGRSAVMERGWKIGYWTKF